MSIITILADHLNGRINAILPQAKTSVLKQADVRELITITGSLVTMGIRSDMTFVNLCARVGNRIQDTLELKRDSIEAVRLGSFVVETFEANGLFRRKMRKPKGKPKANLAYFVSQDFGHRDALTSLIAEIPRDESEYMPLAEPVAPWVTGTHENGLPIVRHAPRAVLEKFSDITHPIIFNVLNRAQDVGWRVDQGIFSVYKTLLGNEKLATFVEGENTYPAFGHLDPNESDSKVISGKAREANAVMAVAEKVGVEAFYHQYNLDFRGRVYPTSSYLNEQSSDNAKGMLVMDKGEYLNNGLRWLAIHAANCYGNDKITLDDRELFTFVNMSDWMAFVNDPIANRGWLKADKPWSFLAAISEIAAVQDWTSKGHAVEDFITHLPVFIDGSCNGIQHLTALSKDEITAPYVNLVASPLPGDVYMVIADAVWGLIEKEYDISLDAQMREFIQYFAGVDAEYANIKGFGPDAKAQRKALSERVTEYREANKDALRATSVNYWNVVTDPKKHRKVTKRPAMCLGYGGTIFGFKEMVLDDAGGIDDHFRDMTHVWAYNMAKRIMEACVGSPDGSVAPALPGASLILNLVTELATKKCSSGERFAWTVPATDFIVVQQYRKPITKRVVIQYMGERMDLSVSIMENQKVDARQQVAAANPNLIHSYDSGHLMLTVDACDFQVVTIHDSWGCTAGNMDALFENVREQFVAFYAHDPLTKLLTEQGEMAMMPELGSLDISGILESDYAFA